LNNRPLTYDFTYYTTHHANYKHGKQFTDVWAAQHTYTWAAQHTYTAKVTIVRLLKHYRQFSFIFEQPAGSFMFKMGCFRAIIASLGLTTILTWMGCFEHAMDKPTHLVGDLPQLMRLARTMAKADRLRIAAARAKRHGRKGTVSIVFVQKSKDGKFSGTKHLQGSAEYTASFCRAVFAAWKASQSSNVVSLNALEPQ
jgi:hypothetical protein